MKIACLGWGSLIWDPRCLPLQGSAPWRSDGPNLSVEFARQSQDGRITLVLLDDGPIQPVLWAEMNIDNLTQARQSLATREKTAQRQIGFLELSSPTTDAPAKILAWAEEHRFAGVVWTNLRPQFRGVTRKPTEDEVVEYLDGLRGETRESAEEYVRMTPSQIVTPYRAAIEDRLGWRPNESTAKHFGF